MSAKFTDLKLHKINKGNLLAGGSVTIAGPTPVSISFTVVKGQKGPFVSLPSRKGKDADGNDKWYDQVFFPEKQDKFDLSDWVVAQMNEQNNGEGSQETTGDDGVPF